MLEDYEKISKSEGDIEEVIKVNQKLLIDSIYSKQNFSQVITNPRDVPKSFNLPFFSEFKKEISYIEYIAIAIEGETTHKFLKEIYNDYLPHHEQRNFQLLKENIINFPNIENLRKFEGISNLHNFCSLMNNLKLTTIEEFKKANGDQVSILKENLDLFKIENLTKIIEIFENLNSL